MTIEGLLYDYYWTIVLYRTTRREFWPQVAFWVNVQKLLHHTTERMNQDFSNAQSKIFIHIEFSF